MGDQRLLQSPLLTKLVVLFGLHFSLSAPSTATIARNIPPRGFNPCNGLQCDMARIGEQALKDLASSMVATGLAAANYSWFNLDDGIISHRDSATGELVADTTAFPSGTLLPLAKYVNSLGLQLGAYTDRGEVTCEGRPGAKGHEAQDAATWVSWGVQWLKSDSCSSSTDFSVALDEYTLMAQGLRATGVDVFFSLCGWFAGFASFSTVGVGDTWRVATDVPNLERFLQNIEGAAAASAFSGPGRGWPDVDMIGGHWSASEETLHLAFIVTIGAPLLLSFNISNSGASTLPLEAYLNPELLAIHSDDPKPAVTKFSRYYGRVSGGPVSGVTTADNPGIPLDTAVPCDSHRASFAWTPTSNGSAWGSLVSAALPGFCLGYWDTWAGACIDPLAVQLVPCTGAQSEGCPAGARTWRYNASTARLQGNFAWGGGTPSSPAPLLTWTGRVPGALYVQSEGQGGLSQEQSWVVTPAVNSTPACAVTIASRTTGQCLGAPTAISSTNVWARWLANGDVGLLFFNVGKDIANVTCDAACFDLVTAGVPHTLWAARDVLARKAAGTIDTRAGYTAVQLAPRGGTLLLRLSPA